MFTTMSPQEKAILAAAFDHLKQGDPEWWNWFVESTFK